MRCHAWIAAVLVALTTGDVLWAGNPAPCGEPGSSCWQQMAPAGGWCPYGGGLLHWWNPDWFPHGGAPDLYHRKQPPCFKWHPYSHDYIWAPLGSCGPDSKGH